MGDPAAGALKVVVAICTADREHYLGKLLERLATIDLGQLSGVDVSVLIVDNRPGGATRKLCERAGPGLPVPVTLVEEPRPGIAEARNRAVAEALATGADSLAFLDDDGLPHPDWLARLLERQRETGADVVMGNRRKFSGEGDPAVAVPGASRTMLEEGASLWKRNGLPNLLATCNVLIATPLLAQMGAQGPVFDPLYSAMGGEDADFFLRARRTGASFAAAPGSLIDFRTEGVRGTAVGRIKRKFKAGCAQGHIARHYLGGMALPAWIASLLWRLARDLVLLLPDLLRRGTRGEIPGKLASSGGMCFGLLGGRYRYYGSSGASE